MKYGLIGKKLGHSFSSELHRRIGGYDYELKELRQEELDAFFEERDFIGINVTIPYKETVLPYLDEIDPLAAAIGSVNTVVNRCGKLSGYNTDLGGMIALIRRIHLDLCGKKVLILGTGGTSKTAHAAAKRLGAKEVYAVSRTGKGGALTYPEALDLHHDADVIINTTPVGMYPNWCEHPLPLTSFSNLCGLVDAIYNPLQTRLVLEARQRGIPAEGGLYMLVAQAVLASELFTGRAIPSETVDHVFRDILREKSNLVLIGMPDSGKTTVGNKAAQILGREFVDLDGWIEKRAGTSVPEIISRDGEAAFRQMESAAVREISVRNGLVIATGGGCVMRQENVNMLRQNGRLFLLNRPAGELRPSADRPLSDTMEKLEELFRLRMPVYRAAADEIIESGATASETAEAVISLWNEVLT